MKARPTKNTPPVGCGSVRADEAMTLRQLGRVLNLSRQALCTCQRRGLKTITLGRVKVVLGEHVLAWLREQAERQAGGPDQ